MSNVLSAQAENPLVLNVGKLMVFFHHLPILEQYDLHLCVVDGILSYMKDLRFYEKKIEILI